MALTNPNKLINVKELQYFEGKIAGKYQTQSISVDGISATTVEDALEEIAGKVGAIPSAILPKGTRTFSQLIPGTDLVASNVGFMWNISDAFVTTSDFVEGAGHKIPKGANVYVANPSDGTYKYDVFQGDIDLSGYKTKQEAVTDSNATTEGTGVTFVDAVTQNANGEITVHKKSVQKADTSNDGLMSSSDFSKLGALPTKEDLENTIGGKVDKPKSATNGNFAALDSNGNITDSGHKHSDYQLAGDYKTKQTAVSDPTAGSAPALEFIATITQNANGEITVTKQGIQVATDGDIDELFA